MKTFTTLFLFGIIAFALQAQNVPIFLGFEQTEDNSAWQFVNGTNQNAWVIGEAASFKGSRSLYVSADGGATNNFVSAPALSVVYRYFDLAVGQYEISFDFRMQPRTGAALYVVWIEESQNFNITANQTGTFPAALAVGPLPASNAWRNFTIQVRVRERQDGSGLPERNRLAFFWRNTSDVISTPVSAAIDNVQIGSLATGTCARPFHAGGTAPTLNTTERISVTKVANGIQISWLDRTWFNIPGDYPGFPSNSRPGRPNLQTQYARMQVAERFDIMFKDIRGDDWTVVLTDITPGWRNDTIYYIIPYLPEGVYTFWVRGRCGSNTGLWAVSPLYINTDKCINFTDLHGANVIAASGTFHNPHQYISVVDFGELDPRSRHTVNTIQGRFEERTVTTLENGEVIALRTIPENAVASVRLGGTATWGAAQSLTYTHTVCENSNILILQYALVLTSCGVCDTNAPNFQLEIWNENGLIGGNCGNFLVRVRDGLRNYVCGPGGSLASFDLIDGWHSPNRDIFWKDWSATAINLSGLEGQTIRIRLTSRGCWGGGHYSYAYFTLGCAPREILKNSIENSLTAPFGFRYEWFNAADMNTVISRERTLYLEPNDVSTYIVRVITLAQGRENCYFELKINLGESVTTHRFAEICEGESYNFHGRELFVSGTYADTLNVNGTVSIEVLHLTVHRTFERINTMTVHESNLPFHFRDTIFDVCTVSGEYRFPLQTIHGCDSIIVLNLTVERGELSIFTPEIVFFNIAPNPIKAGEAAFIHHYFSAAEKAGLRVEIITGAGTLLHMYQPAEFPINVGKHIHSSGIYIIRITTGDGKVLIGRLMVM